MKLFLIANILVCAYAADFESRVQKSSLSDAANSPEQFVLKGEVDHKAYLEKITKLEGQLSVCALHYSSSIFK